jgi:hypothetical protein
MQNRRHTTSYRPPTVLSPALQEEAGSADYAGHKDADNLILCHRRLAPRGWLGCRFMVGALRMKDVLHERLETNVPLELEQGRP